MCTIQILWYFFYTETQTLMEFTSRTNNPNTNGIPDNKRLKKLNASQWCFTGCCAIRNKSGQMHCRGASGLSLSADFRKKDQNELRVEIMKLTFLLGGINFGNLTILLMTTIQMQKVVCSLIDTCCIPTIAVAFWRCFSRAGLKSITHLKIS